MNCWAAGRDATDLLAETVRLTDATASLPRQRAGMTLPRAHPPGNGLRRERSGMKLLRKARGHEACAELRQQLKPTQPRMFARGAQRLN